MWLITIIIMIEWRQIGNIAEERHCRSIRSTNSRDADETVEPIMGVSSPCIVTDVKIEPVFLMVFVENNHKT